MPRKFNRVKDTKYIIDALINGDFEQAKKRTLKGLKVLLSEESCVYPHLRKNQADELAHRICDVLIRISCSTKLEYRHRYDLMTGYRHLFR